MSQSFEAMVRLKFSHLGFQYRLDKDIEGCYVSEIVRRMWDVYRDCKSGVA